ncbi:O-antigen ligase family protein [Acetivibrio clariflavus]|uniref:Lipid A core-O-antigen ligase-like enyme n=1 Tax=Acetivibrio clariflavus (strain DSM 19732 / NBRC 101661 / EBR45) TaxID=720554 RepID=G8M1B8_ACECE|nr:O-antigen ligase family protein [Acetivibrio clariflavus]AEV68094.1 lipid A core-O-antigen ligase-like enyme [Acetivibrio clariflavus DSM 19732]
MGSPEDEEKQIDLISFILVVLVVAVLPFVAIPKVVNTPVNTWYFLDIHGYSKMVFLIIISMIMLTLMGFKRLARKQHIKICLPLALFLLWVLVSLFFAKDRAVAFHGYPLRWQGFVAYFCYAVVFTFIVNMVKKKDIGKILTAYFIAVSISAIHSIVNYYGIEPLNIITKTFFDAKIVPEISRGTLGNRNTAGAFFTIPTVMSLVMFLKSKSYEKNILYYSYLVLSYAALLVSLTRVAWLGAIGAIALTIWVFRKYFKEYLKKFLLIAVSFAIILVLLDVSGNGRIVGRYYSMKDQFKQAYDGNVEQFGSSRIFIYGKAFKVIAEHPIVGTGPDCFAYYSVITREEYEKHPELSGIGYFDKVHSEYLEYAATMGIPALMFYLWFLLSIFIPWIKKGKEISPEIFAILLGLTGYLLQACFNFGTISTLPGVFVLLGILKNALGKEKNEENNERIENFADDSAVIDINDNTH